MYEMPKLSMVLWPIRLTTDCWIFPFTFHNDDNVSIHSLTIGLHIVYMYAHKQ